MEMSKDIKITFAPGALDDFDGTQEELDDLLDEIASAIESGEFFEVSLPLEDDEDIWEAINQRPNTRQ